MLFGKKKCTQCESSYDKVEETCPVCGAQDEHYRELQVPENVIWLPMVKQILLFVFGYAGLMILGFIGELITMCFHATVDAAYYMSVNAIRYLGILVLMVIFLWNNFPKFKKSFTKAKPYLIGLAGGVALLASNIIINLIINSFYTTTVNQNQSVANDMVMQYPVLCIIILGFVGPIVEELTYRVGLFNFLLRGKRWIAYLVSIAIFALIHFDFFAGSAEAYINELLNLPSYIAAGLIMTFLYDRFGLASSLVAHVFNNLYSVIIAIILTMI